MRNGTHGLQRMSNQLKYSVAVFQNDEDKVHLAFGRGSFDDWCIYVLSGNRKWMKFPTDEWYFNIVKSWTQFRDPQEIYNDFVKIYDATTADPTGPATRPVIEMIKGIAWNYKDFFEAQVIFTILYMGMIAEENKEGAILKKRIKRLGMYQVLVEGLTPHEAAHFSRGKSVISLAPHCNERGF